MLQTDIRHDLTQTFYEAMDPSLSEELESIYTKLEDEAREVLGDEGVPGGRMELLRTADMRYVGQEYFVNVELPQNGRLTEDALDELTDRFHSAYRTRYGHSTPGAPVEFVNLRVAALGELERDVAGFKPPSGGEVPPHDTRDVIFEGERAPTKIFRRDRIGAGAQASGPLVIEEDTATTVVPPGWGARVDELGNVIITQEEGS